MPTARAGRKGSLRVDKALLDTSTYLDIRRAAKSRRSLWARSTLENLLAYRSRHDRLTISAFTAYELLDGIHRDGVPGASVEFRKKVLPAFEVIYPDEPILDLCAEINAKLANSRQIIGVIDTMIAATAITRNLILVNSNPKHFARVQSLGYGLHLQSWRDNLPQDS